VGKRVENNQAPNGAKDKFAEPKREGLILILIAPLPIPESQSNPKHHNSNRRQQQHQHGPVQSLLTFFGRAPRIRIAHGAALSVSGRGPERTRQQKDCERIAKTGHDFCPIPTPFGGG